MLFVDALFRFSGVGLLLILALLAWSNRTNWRSTPYLVLACVSVAALFLSYAPPQHLPPEPLLTITRLADIPHLVFVWMFALSLFGDRFTLRVHHIIIGLLYSAPILWIRMGDLHWIAPPPRIMIPIGSASSILLVAHLIWATLRGRRDDLLERRRAVRIYFILTIATVAVAAALSDLIPPDAALDRRTAKVVAIWPAILFGTIWMLTFDRTAVQFGARTKNTSNLMPKDQALWYQLTLAMETQQVFRDADLTIGSLAKQLGVGEHRLRALINTKLGFINFSTFVNSYRVAAVQGALADPEQADMPILTLALDAGFRSLSPFNKAFKETTGTTPSEYRKAAAQN